MIKHLLPVLVCVLASAFGVNASVATASNGATTTSYTASFVNGPTGFFVCSGVRVVKTAPTPTVKDSETCDVAVGEFVVPDGVYALGLSPPFHTWYSDYEYFVSPGGCLNPSASGTITVRSRGPGRQTGRSWRTTTRLSSALPSRFPAAVWWQYAPYVSRRRYEP
jgi:hypothetical protein